MSRFETVAVPFKLVGNRQILTEQQVVEQPWLLDFIRQFRHCFEYDENREVYLLKERDHE